MSDVQKINGNAFSWSSIAIKIDGQAYFGIKSISYGDKLTRAKGYGVGRNHAPRSRTAGKYEIDPVSISMEHETAAALRAALAERSTSGTSFGSVEFLVVVQYVEGDRVVTDEIERCTWSGQSAKNEESADPLYTEAEFDAMRIRWDGRYLFDDSEGA